MSLMPCPCLVRQGIMSLSKKSGSASFAVALSSKRVTNLRIRPCKFHTHQKNIYLLWRHKPVRAIQDIQDERQNYQSWDKFDRSCKRITWSGKRVQKHWRIRRNWVAQQVVLIAWIQCMSLTSKYNFHMEQQRLTPCSWLMHSSSPSLNQAIGPIWYRCGADMVPICPYGVPVVPRKAVAEVSRIGNLWKPIGEVGCCESRMAGRIHWWTDRWLELCFWNGCNGCSGHLTATVGCSVV